MDPVPVTPPRPSWRKPAGIFLILLLIAVWAVLVASVAPLLAGLPRPLHTVYYVAAGIVWILPLKPLLRWMEKAPRAGGEWRE